MIPVAIVGGGLAGIVAALAASEVGCKVVLFERDNQLGGTRASLPTVIPGIGTRYQKLAGVTDSEQNFARDIQLAAGTFGDPVIIDTLSERASSTIEWLTERFGIAFELLEEPAFGHSVRRMHCPSADIGSLSDFLASQLEASGVAAITGVEVTGLHFRPERQLYGLDVATGEGGKTLPCDSVILATGGFSHSRTLVTAHLPLYKRLPSLVDDVGQNNGIAWVHQADAAIRDMDTHNAALMIAEDVRLDRDLISMGAFVVNCQGERFVNELDDWDALTASMAMQSNATGWVLMDDQIHRKWQDSEACRSAARAGAIRRGRDSVSLAHAIDISSEKLTDLLSGLDNISKKDIPDSFGRKFANRTMRPPWFAVKVEADLLATHGGVVVDRYGAVLRTDRTPVPGLFAAGEMVSGLAGPGQGKSLTGNDMLMSIVMGRIAGETAAQTVRAAA